MAIGTDLDLTVAAFRHLSADPLLANVAVAWRHESRSTPTPDRAVIVVSQAGSHTPATPWHPSSLFPRLRLEIVGTSPDQVLLVWKLADGLLHRPFGELNWDELRVVSCERLTEPNPAIDESDNYVHSGPCDYGVQIA